MTLPIYLAMTDTEMHQCSALPAHVAYMACHFSPYGTGLCNLPSALPAGSMLIMNDRIPVRNHEPDEILSQLQELLEEITCSAVLLDFQRSDCRQTYAIAKILTEKIPLQVGVSQHYARDLDCPVLVEPPPLHVPLSQHLKPWEGRQLWLDAALVAGCYGVDSSGCSQTPCGKSAVPLPHHDPQLHCHYQICQNTDHVIFTLERTAEDVEALLFDAERLGVTTAIGLYQEWESAKILP